MSDEYRDPLAAAHARIAELEEKIATLEAESSASKRFTAAGRFPQLEVKIEGLRLRADDKLAAQRRTALTWVGLLFPLASAFFSFMHLPLYATAASVVFIGMMLLNIRNTYRSTRDKKLLAEAEKELADAHRIAELEAKLAETEQRVRVASDAVAPERQPFSEDAAELAARRS